MPGMSGPTLAKVAGQSFPRLPVLYVSGDCGNYGDQVPAAVRQRTAELGVRMAVGAAPWSLFQLVVAHGLRLSIAGIAVGVLAALGLTRAIQSMLIGVTATDPATYVAMAAGFLLVTVAACWIPARRAAGLDPVRALREE